MPRFPVASTRGQVEADRELVKKLEEEERLKRHGPVEIPGDEEFALCLQEKMEEAEQSGGGPDAAAKALEIDFGEMTSSTEDKEWEVNRGEMMMSIGELRNIREKYGVPLFVGMRTNPTGYERSHPPKGTLRMFASVLVTGFRVSLDKYERVILTHLDLAPIQLTPNSCRRLIGLRAAFKEIGYGDPSVDLLEVLFDTHANKPPRVKNSKGDWTTDWRGLTRFYYLRPRPRPRFSLEVPGEGDLLLGKPSNVKGWKKKYFLLTYN